MKKPTWEHFHHRADIGVRGLGDTPGQAFAQAAVALTGVICTPESVNPARAVTLTCESPDLELLLVDWLNSLIYEMAVMRMLFSRFEVSIEDARLSATAWGESVDVSRHQPAVEVKGATYTELQVKQMDDGRWLAQCVVDV